MHYYCNKISPFILNNNNVISRDRLRRTMKYRRYDYRWYVIKDKNLILIFVLSDRREFFFLPMHTQSYFYLFIIVFCIIILINNNFNKLYYI